MHRDALCSHANERRPDTSNASSRSADGRLSPRHVVASSKAAEAGSALARVMNSRNELNKNKKSFLKVATNLARLFKRNKL